MIDGFNTYSGVTSISEGNLLIRNGRSSLGVGGAGNHVFITGNGSISTNNGIVIGSANSRKDILVGPLSGGQTIMNASGDTTYLYGNITIDNVDLAGQALFTPLINVGANSLLIVDGNITGGSTAITSDVVATSSRVLSTAGSSSGFMILRGQLGDKLDPQGNAIPVPGLVSTLPNANVPTLRSNQNELFRFTITGDEQLNVTMERQTNAAGRLTLDSGILYVSYDPVQSGNDGTGFWSNAAISRISGGNSNADITANGNSSQHGFTIGGGGNTAIFLGQPGSNGISGQQFNMTSWSLAAGNTTYLGGINESGSIGFGTGNGTLTLNKQARLYAMAGGTVNFNMRYGGAQSIQKTGRGDVVYQFTGAALAASDTSSFELGGGRFIIDHQGTNVARFGNAGNFTFRGGSLVSLGRSDAAFTASYSTETGASRTVNFGAGTNEIVAQTRGQNLSVTLGNTNTTNGNVTRSNGAAVNFVENASAGGLQLCSCVLAWPIL